MVLSASPVLFQRCSPSATAPEAEPRRDNNDRTTVGHGNDELVES